MKMCLFWPKSKAIALVYCLKMTKKLKLVDVDCKVNIDENEPFVAKK